MLSYAIYAMPCHAMLCYAMRCYAMLCYVTTNGEVVVHVADALARAALVTCIA